MSKNNFECEKCGADLNYLDGLKAIPSTWYCPECTQPIITLKQKEHERLMILAVKHCPKNHHDWEEVLELTTALDTNR